MGSQHRWPCWLFWQLAISILLVVIKFCSVLFCCEPHCVGEMTEVAQFYRNFCHVLFRFRAMLTLPVVCGVVAVLASVLPLFSADHPADGPFLYTTKGLFGYLRSQRRSVGYRRLGRTAILPPPKVVRCSCPLTILMLAAKLSVKAKVGVYN